MKENGLHYLCGNPRFEFLRNKWVTKKRIQSLEGGGGLEHRKLTSGTEDEVGVMKGPRQGISHFARVARGAQGNLRIVILKRKAHNVDSYKFCVSQHGETESGREPWMTISLHVEPLNQLRGQSEQPGVGGGEEAETTSHVYKP